MKRRYLPTILGVALLSAGVIAYNYWSLMTGRCTLSSLVSLGPPALVLILCNLVAFIVYCGVRAKNRHATQLVCPCGNSLRHDWLYCPNCGSAGSGIPSA